MLQIGTVLERRYRVDYIIKQGGMGTVYCAQDLRLERLCAVKAIPASLANDVEQFRREAHVLARLCHPHLPAIFDCIEQDNGVSVVMQLIPGDDLETLLLRHGPPAWNTVLDWALQLADAVQYLHDQMPPVIHRDIKPANVRLAPNGQIFLVDFGIAKILDGAATHTAARAASVPYAPIEQIQDGSHTDQQSDVYSFGTTLYRLLTGALPPSCIDRLVGKDLIPISTLNSSVPEALEVLIHHCMELWNSDRPATMAAVMARLNSMRTATAHSSAGVQTVVAARQPAPVRRVVPEASSSRPIEPFEPSRTARTALQEGRTALEQGNITAAYEHFSEAIRLSETFAEAHAARAEANTQLGDLDAARDDWDRALLLQPRRAAWYRRRGIVQRYRRHLSAAIEDFSMAIDLDPAEYDAFLERAKVKRELGDTRGHLQDLDDLLNLAPRHWAARVLRVRTRLDQQLWQPALQDCATLIQENPGDATGWVLRARIYAELGDIARALRDCSDAIAAMPQTVEAYYFRGRLYQRISDPQAALRDYSQALTIDPEHIEALRARATLYRASGAELDALKDYQALCRALRKQIPGMARYNTDTSTQPPRRPLALELEYLMQTASMEKARKHLQSQAALFRDDSEEELEERAGLFVRVGRFDLALDDYERVVKLLWSRLRPPALSAA